MDEQVTVTVHQDANTVTMQLPVDGDTGNTLHMDAVLVKPSEISGTPLDKPVHPGQPCKFCSDKERVMTIAMEYLKACQSETKLKIPFLAELAIKIGIHRETLHNWRSPTDEYCKENHRQFFDVIKILETMQEWRLQQGLMGRYNPTGKIFLLKTKHGYMETEKQIIAGSHSEPLEITITEDSHVIAGSNE